MKVKIKKLHPNAVIPSRGTEYSAGMDITSVSVDISNSQYIEYKTGLSFEIPPGHMGLLFPRSSISKYDLSLANAVGIVDADFRGEITFRFKQITHFGNRLLSSTPLTYKVGERIGQLVIVPYPNIEFEETAELSDTVRGAGGYGSTNK